MSEFKPSPGPWVVQDMREYGAKHINIQAFHEETGDYTVGQITDPGIDVPDLDLLANAQLMRYAPDMLTILDHFLDELAHHCNTERPLSGPYEDAEAIVRLFKDKS